MSNYFGVKCPVCGKKFTNSDDIVVCPVCGAPHHRDCYAKENACAFSADHLSGKEWRPPAPDPVHQDGETSHSWSKTHEDSDGTAVCGTCKTKNAKSAIFCQTCGSRMSFDSESFWGNPYINIDPVTVVYGGLDPNEKIEDETARDLAVYIGSNSAYYLPRFKAIAKTDRTVMFNFPAMVFGFFYFFYRKMYLIGGLLLGLFLLSSVPGFLWMRANPQVLMDMLPPSMHSYLSMMPDTSIDLAKAGYYQQLSNIASMIDFVIRIVISFCATRLYFLKVMGDVKLIRETQPEKHDEIAYCDELRYKGGTSKAVIIALLSAYFVLSFIVAAYISYKFVLM